MPRLLLPIRLTSLVPTPNFELLGVDLEELIRFLGMSPGNIMEGGRRDVVGLAFSNQRVILDQILQLRVVALRLSA